jgi:peptidoglycan/xylan/chitin deacetylase (PgdA/CDA1 family)
VALTFHGDGPVEIVRGVLRDLARADAHVTVLGIGRWLAASPDVARMIRDAGHELGNHTWSHQTMPRLSAAAVREEVDRAAAELVKLTGSPGRWFRPSGTPHSTRAIRAAAVAAGYGACLGYDVDPLDYTDPGPAAITRRLATSVRPGSIVSLHLGHPGTLTALPTVLSHLHDRGLAPVTASALLLNG